LLGVALGGVPAPPSAEVLASQFPSKASPEGIFPISVST
tara:strand:- start:605 stop:721 length:117 start_codon:yes stop_codon:yes gene_type:complete